MKNLAGNPECDVFICEELTKAHIEIIEAPEPACCEVPARLTGRLGKFTFVRAWYYWMVNGPVPLAVAEELYADPNGVNDVRVAGHCGCPPPKEWACRLTPDGRSVVTEKQRREAQDFFWRLNLRECLETYEREHVCKAAAPESALYVTSYHIDTQEGLNLFTAKLREHGLAGEVKP